MSDRVFGALALIFAFVYGLQARTFQSDLQIGDPLGPDTFPYLLAVVMGVTALYLIVRPDPSPHWPDPPHLVQMALIVLVLCVYAVLLEDLGFIVATFAAVAILSWRLGARPTTALLTGAGVSFGLYGLFDRVLGLPLPLGLLEFA